MIDENELHGTGRRIENASEGIMVQVEKKVESPARGFNAYIYLIMDAQLNIENDAYVSAVYEDVHERTTHCIVCSSNRSRKNSFSIEPARE